METISHLSSGEAEHGRNEAELPLDFTLADPFACPFLHVHCLVTSDRSPGTQNETEALASFYSSFYGPVILFQNIVQILHRPQSTAATQLPFVLNCFTAGG
jgi:hypothetical protein